MPETEKYTVVFNVWDRRAVLSCVYSCLARNEDHAIRLTEDALKAGEADHLFKDKAARDCPSHFYAFPGFGKGPRARDLTFGRFYVIHAEEEPRCGEWDDDYPADRATD